MKKCLVLMLAILLLFTSLAACEKDDPQVVEDVYFTVTFDCAGGSPIESIKVLAETMLTKPENPTKEGYIFNGWKNGTMNWMFGVDRVRENVTLTATWIDARNVFSHKVNADGQSVTITGFNGIISDVEVPEVLAGMPVTAIGKEAFSTANSESVKRITVPESITYFEEYSFYECKEIRVVIESKPTYIGEKAFYDCNKLEYIELGEGIESVPYMAFGKCTSLTGIVLPSSVKEISENAFEYCSSLKTVMLHKGIENIADSAFVGCENLTAVYFYGTDAEWDEIEISEGNNGNDHLLDAKLFLYSETEPTDGVKNKYWHFDRDGKVRIW